jgi:hypothetical protein
LPSFGAKGLVPAVLLLGLVTHESAASLMTTPTLQSTPVTEDPVGTASRARPGAFDKTLLGTWPNADSLMQDLDLSVAILPAPRSPLHQERIADDPNLPSEGRNLELSLAILPAPTLDLAEDRIRDDAQLPSEGETLARVARSIITVRRLPAAQSGWHPEQPQASGRRAAGDDDDGPGISQALLDSQVLGSMLEAAVAVTDIDHDARIFSVLGIGDFELDVTPGDPGITLSERSSDIATTIPYASFGITPLSETTKPEVKITLVELAWRLLLEFLSTPVGFLLSIVGSVYLVVWGIIKVAGLIRWWTFPDPNPARRGRRLSRH